MELYNQIFARKSCRKYDMNPLEPKFLAEIEAYAATMKSLIPGTDLDHRIVGQERVRGLMSAKAPHYLIISGKPGPNRDLCAGHMYQQLDLYLSSRGIGSCWLGGAKSKEGGMADQDIITISFGWPLEPVTRAVGEFKRKSIQEISQGDDPRLNAVRLAPSAVNGQPWFFIADEGIIHVYKRVHTGLKSMLYRYVELDVGIALCHLHIASDRMELPFHFNTTATGVPAGPAGYRYVGTVQ